MKKFGSENDEEDQLFDDEQNDWEDDDWNDDEGPLSDEYLIACDNLGCWPEASIQNEMGEVIFYDKDTNEILGSCKYTTEEEFLNDLEVRSRREKYSEDRVVAEIQKFVAAHLSKKRAE